MALDIEIISDSLGIARGLLAGVESRRVFGHSNAVPTSFRPVADPTVEAFQFVTSVSTVVSDDDTDQPSQAGAQKILLQGLEIDGTEVTIESPLDGTTLVVTADTLFRLNTGILPPGSVGTYAGSNIGTITIKNQTSGDVIGIIDPGVGVTQNGVFTIPKGKTGYMAGANVAAESSQSVSFRLCARLGAGDVVAPYNPVVVLDQVDGISGSAPLLSNAWLKVPEFTDLWIDAKAQTPAMAGARFDIFLVDNVEAIQSTFK